MDELIQSQIDMLTEMIKIMQSKIDYMTQQIQQIQQLNPTIASPRYASIPSGDADFGYDSDE